MRSKLLWALCLLFALTYNLTYGQEIEKKGLSPVSVQYPDKIEHVASLSSRSNLILDESDTLKEMDDGRVRESKINMIPGKGSKGPDPLAKNPHRLKNTIPTRMPEFVFETAASSSAPTDPAGAVGPNHYFAVINTGFRIFDKSGNPLTAQLDETNIFTSSGCCDLTASYDDAADKWVLTLLGAGVQVAVSDGPDPVNDTWTVYTYGSVNDYQKMSVWSDGYYMTDNNGGLFHIFERDAMIDPEPASGTTPQIVTFNLTGLVTFGFHSPHALSVSAGPYPALGGATIVALQDDAWGGGITQDHIKYWTVDIDWSNPMQSNVSAPTEIPLAPFVNVFDGGSFSNLPQPGGGQAIDALQGLIYNQAQFRKFGTHNSALFSFVVDVDPTVAKQAAVRWVELRQTADNQPWTLYQEGTYTAPDNRHAWNSSLTFDVQGNIGMGYTSMSSPNSADPNVVVGTYYTGRYASDPLGTMTVAEQVIQAGDANIPGPFDRYGDYSKIDIDPDGDKKFWFVNEIMASGRKNVAGVFQLAPNFNNDVGVISVDTPTDGALSNAETITVTVRNFGELDASGFNVTYQVDGGTVVSEAYAGTLTAGATAQHVFAATADLSTQGQTYSITSCTDYTTDEDNSNDCVSQDVTHILADDIGVTEITSPVSGEGLGNETVTVTIENFGTQDQSGFDVQYAIDGGTPVVETVVATVLAGGTLSYSFTALANLSSVATYNIVATTLLGADSDNANDSTSTDVTNVSCQSQSNTTSQPIGPDAGSFTNSVVTYTDDFVINDVNVTIDLVHTWNADLEIRLIGPGGSPAIYLCQDVGSSSDNMTNTVFDDEASTPISSGTGPFTGSFIPQESLSAFDGLQSIGDWTLEILDDANFDGGTFLGWTLQLCSNTNLSVDDPLIEEGITIIYEEDNQFLVKLPTSSINERLQLTVQNVLGQTIYYKSLENESGNGYEHRLDMSYVAAGMYFVKIGNNNQSNIKRIIVK
ncbi:MAG: proprotein convertase P-domain-containing protein [Bacteroidia bacterium]|nr:proprotein convertase P-domain-containing protein [Bacteroidia bacterium]MBT8269262.1 proprotein convertase P-domain-containing protein [Bacteroidia bacterium]NNF81624.1 T9SS type A sorting domain-containing protein [Flavobacteriaceae bacterium]NNK70798.1 T9SS type A sorting domain-containing protein [Flavobacteriaceae bacterium]NNL80247.1 T9SS type A sorting domain-containing protein [Flavobacteriaceae bacterium]